MKVTGPSSGSPGAAPSAGTGKTEGKTEVGAEPASKTEGKTEGSGKAFAQKLGGAESTTHSAPGALSAQKSSATADIAADLQAGRLQPKAAVQKLLDQVLARQVGADAPPAFREKVRAALQETLENDPLLSEKLRSLDNR